MDFSYSSLVGSLFVSGVGFALFQYGRRRSRGLCTIFGIIMMIYPYLVTDWVWMVGIGVAMCALLYWLENKPS